MIEDFLEYYEREMGPPKLQARLSRRGWARELHKERLEKILAYIKVHNLSDAQLDGIQAILKSRAQQSRITTVYFAVTFAALAVPVWDKYTETLIERFKDTSHGLYTVVWTLFLLSGSLAILRASLAGFFDDVIISNYKRLDELLAEARLLKLMDR
jgi:hypothetical protein